MIEHKAALVTGGSRGIGRAICIELAKAGYAIALNFKENLSAAEEASALCEEAGAAVELCQGDVAAASERELIVQFVMERFGRIDFLVNSAGIGPQVRHDILQTPLESFERVINTNLTGPYFLTQGVANEMIQLRERGVIEWGGIVNISSIRAYTAGLEHGEYCVSKAGLSMVTTLFAARLARYDIHVHEISPGIIESDTTESQEVREAYSKKPAAGVTPIDRWGKAEEVAQAVAAIARREFPFSTGQVFHIDGGWHLRHL